MAIENIVNICARVHGVTHRKTAALLVSWSLFPSFCLYSETACLAIIIIIFIYCNWVVTRWQWLFYM